MTVSTGTQAGAWLGMNELQVKGSFTWSDTSPVTFTNWWIGMPISSPSKTCVVMTKAVSAGVRPPCAMQHNATQCAPAERNTATQGKATIQGDEIQGQAIQGNAKKCDSV